MKKYQHLIYIFFSIFLQLSCDGPRDRRSTRGDATASTVYIPYTSPDLAPPSSANEDSVQEALDDASASRDAGGQLNIPTDATHCKFATDGKNGFGYSSDDLGEYSICASGSTSNKYYFQISEVMSDEVCFFPTHTTSQGLTTFIGDPLCLRVSSVTAVYPLNFKINRNGLTHLQMTGVMIMKDRTEYYGHPFNRNMSNLDAYFQCSQWLMETGNTALCASFKENGSYTNHVFSAVN